MASEQCSDKKLSVLRMDDDPIIHRINKMLLKKVDAEAETEIAVNGMEAVELCIVGASFYVIFMDLELPVMNGIEATRKLREMGVESMIVGVTSPASEPEILGSFMGAGMNEFYGKLLTVIDKGVPKHEEHACRICPRDCCGQCRSNNKQA